MSLFYLWLLASCVSEKVKKMSFGEFERAVRVGPDTGGDKR
jgi:hypothetical protein